MANENEYNETLQNSDLKDEQKKAIVLLLDYEKDLTQQEVADAVNVDRSTLYRWRKFDEEFKRVKSKLTDKNLAEYLDQVDKSLITEARNGSVRAMELFYKRTDNLVDKKEIAHKGGLDIKKLHKLAQDDETG